MIPRALVLFLAMGGLACSSPSGERDAAEASASVKPDPEAKAPTTEPLEPAPGFDHCGVAHPRGASVAYERACEHLADQADPAPSVPAPEQVPAQWQAIRAGAGTFFAPSGWVQVRDGATLMAVAPGAPEQAFPTPVDFFNADLVPLVEARGASRAWRSSRRATTHSAPTGRRSCLSTAAQARAR